MVWFICNKVLYQNYSYHRLVLVTAANKRYVVDGVTLRVTSSGSLSLDHQEGLRGEDRAIEFIKKEKRVQMEDGETNRKIRSKIRLQKTVIM